MLSASGTYEGAGGGGIQPGGPSPSAAGAVAAVPPAPGGGQISLSLLMEFMVQKVYHDLVVLGELLPRKTDLERKVEIFGFASRTRMLFVRLLALVRWASSASKVDKCSSIQQFLEVQSGLLTNTANDLARMARERLVLATLPNFHLPAAVEVLNTGSYSRVPRCIRDRIVPPEPITSVERRQVLLRLNQVIEHRLVTASSPLPAQMRMVKIENGRVTFRTEHEFEVHLTLLGDTASTPWRLLKTEILVDEKETGEGKSLVHPMQVGFVEQMVQAHLTDHPKPLHQMYKVLHSLSQSLQLEVLNHQTHKLMADRLGDHVRIEEYRPGICLTVSYWRDLLNPGPGTQKKFSNEVGYCFSVQVDPHDPNKPLSVVHMPPLTAGKMDPSLMPLVSDEVIRGGQISLERILVHTIYVRTRTRLQELKDDLKVRLGLGDVEPTLQGSPAVLSIPILEYCLRSEQLLITVDTHTGVFLAHVPQYDTNPFIVDIQTAISEDRSRLEWLVSQMRYWITKQRVHKTLHHLPATSYERLPLLFDMTKHPLKDVSQNKMYIRLHHQSNAILIVEFHEKPGSPCEMDYRYYLLWVKQASIEDDPMDDSVTANIPKVYLKAFGMIEFDSFLVTHATTTRVNTQDLSEKIIGKRKCGGKSETPIKRRKYPAYFLPDLARMVAFADERIPFMSLSSELTKRGVLHSDVEVQEKAVGLVIKIFKFPASFALRTSSHVTNSIVDRLQKYLLSVNVRMQQRGTRIWRLEFVFVGNPLANLPDSKIDGGRKTLISSFDVGNVESIDDTVDSILKEWTRIVQLFTLVDSMERYMRCEAIDVSGFLHVRSYDFKELTLEYNEAIVKIGWNNSKFQLTFGGINGGAGMNPHSLMKEVMEDRLNSSYNLVHLAKVLQETQHAAYSLAMLPTTPQVGVVLEKARFPVQTFNVVPQSPTNFKIFFCDTYCVDVTVRANGFVCLRDAAISVFNQGKVMLEAHPIPGIKTFLMRYVDENALCRRQSQTEDDNPPSPQVEELKFKTTSSSNPMTPSSPHSSFLQSPPGQPNPSPYPPPSPAGAPGSVGSPFAQSPLNIGSPSRPSPRTPGQGPHSNNPGSVHSVHGKHGNSPAMNFAARTLPQRLWAGANPTPLTTSSFNEICKPSPLSPPSPNLSVSSLNLSPLHRFLGCQFMKRSLQQAVRTENLTLLPSSDQSTVMFKTVGMTAKVSSFASNNFQSLHLKIELDPDPNYQWPPELVPIMEKFFDVNVVSPPYRPAALVAFVRLLQCPVTALKDIVNIMRYEIQPDFFASAKLRWNCRLCLTLPPAAPPIMPLGQPGFLRLKDKMLFFISLTRAGNPQASGQEPLTVVIPIVYDIQQNQTSVAQREMNDVMSIAQLHLQKLARNPQFQMQRCTILPSVHDLLLNLSLDNPPSAPVGQGVPQGVPQGVHQGPPRMRGPVPGGPGMNPRMMHPQMMNQGMVGPGGQMQMRGQPPPVGAVPARPPGGPGS